MPKCGSSNAGSITRLSSTRPRRTVRSGAWLVALLACLWLSAGCAQQRDKRFTYLRGTVPPPLIKVTEAGTYDLVPDDALSPRFSIDLAAGDAYGFRQREDDAIVAVARDKEIELGD